MSKLHSEIELEGVRVHNLRNIDVRLPLEKLTVVTGVSGAGKSSLVFDTLHAEGQRRYVESLSADAARYVERVDRPDADRIEFLPPSIAVRPAALSQSRRSTLATASEIHDYLRLLYAASGNIVCVNCGSPVKQDSPADIVSAVSALASTTRVQLAAPVPSGDASLEQTLRRLAGEGFARAIVGQATIRLVEEMDPAAVGIAVSEQILVVVDRVVAGKADERRLHDSAEQAFRAGEGTCLLLYEEGASPAASHGQQHADRRTIDGTVWRVQPFSRRLDCAHCGRVYLPLTPELFSFHSAQGACPRCEGTGELSFDKYADPRDIASGERRACPACEGARLRPEALAVRLDGRNLAELCGSTVRACLEIAAEWKDRGELPVRAMIVDEIHTRLSLLDELGASYLTLDRATTSMSPGELRRVALAETLSAGLVNSLWVLDEPAVGLHPDEIPPVISAVERLRDAGNTVVIVEHEPRFLASADCVVELGPGGGREGGLVTFAGTATAFLAQKTVAAQAVPEAADEVSSDLPSESTGSSDAGHRLKLTNANRRNLQNIAVEFPLGRLCAVCGVGGSGKRTLVVDCLFGALSRALGVTASAGDNPAEIAGFETLDSVVLIDQRPVRYSSRSVPATALGVFGEIRQVFAETPEARRRNFTRRHFSFNVRGAGACPRCGGKGQMVLDMEFLADVSTTCPECGGDRYRPEVLEVKYRGKTIADILRMTIEEAFGFFRGQRKLQHSLHVVRDVGLGYLPLGQPLSTLSTGESQRLRLTVEMSQSRGRRTLFLLEEPTIGLHPRDIRKLLEFLGQLTAVGHSVLLIEHNPAVLAAADCLVELGPGPGTEGGRVIAAGSPAEVAANPASQIGRHLAPR